MIEVLNVGIGSEIGTVVTGIEIVVMETGIASLETIGIVEMTDSREMMENVVIAEMTEIDVTIVEMTRAEIWVLGELQVLEQKMMVPRGEGHLLEEEEEVVMVVLLGVLQVKTCEEMIAKMIENGVMIEIVVMIEIAVMIGIAEMIEIAVTTDEGTTGVLMISVARRGVK